MFDVYCCNAEPTGPVSYPHYQTDSPAPLISLTDLTILRPTTDQIPVNAIELGEVGRIVHGMTRRKFLGTTIAGGATVLAGTVFQKLALAVTSSATPTTFQLGGDLR